VKYKNTNAFHGTGSTVWVLAFAEDVEVTESDALHTVSFGKDISIHPVK